MSRGQWYAIRSMLPELVTNREEPAALTREYSSGDTVLDFAATVELLKKHRLMIDDVADFDEGEMLR